MFHIDSKPDRPVVRPWPGEDCTSSSRSRSHGAPVPVCFLSSSKASFISSLDLQLLNPLSGIQQRPAPDTYVNLRRLSGLVSILRPLVVGITSSVFFQQRWRRAIAGFQKCVHEKKLPLCLSATPLLFLKSNRAP